MDYLLEHIIDTIGSRLFILDELHVLIILACFFSLLTLKYPKKVKEISGSNSEKTNKILICFILAILLITVCHICYETYYFPKPSQDKFTVLISPFKLDNSEVDSDTANEMKKKIENITNGSIQVKVLGSSPITNEDEDINKGKKDEAHIVIFGEQKRKMEDIDETEFHVIPVQTNLDSLPPQSMISDVTDNATFKAKFCSHSEKNPISIVESLTENVSSTLFAVYALENYEKSNYDSAIGLFESIEDFESKDSVLFYMGNCYYSKGEFNKSLQYYNKSIELDSNSSDAWNNKGVALGNLGNDTEAIKAFNKAL